MIFVENLCKTFKLSRKQRRELDQPASSDTVDAVHNVSFTCRPGRIFALLGPNGAGKTTTLRIIATMLKPSSGTVTVSRHDAVRESQAV